MIYINRGTIPKIPDTNDTDIYAEVDTGLVSLRQHNTERPDTPDHIEVRVEDIPKLIGILRGVVAHSKREQDTADA